MEKNSNPAATPPPPLTQAEEDEAEKVFKKFDTNGDGKISPAELGAVLNGLGSKTSAEDVKRMISELDCDGDGLVDLNEFKSSGIHYGVGTVDNEELKDAFGLYDKDKNGKISASELQEVLQSLREKCSIEDCEYMISFFDVDDDGCINFEEFKKMMTPGSGAS